MGPKGIAASSLVVYNGGLLFSGQDPDLGKEIWYSDGTAVGTVLLKDIFPGSGGSNPSSLTSFSKDNRVYFAAEGPICRGKSRMSTETRARVFDRALLTQIFISLWRQ